MGAPHLDCEDHKMSVSRLLSLAALLACPAFAPAQFVVNTDTGFGMDDGAITPDGRYGVVKMNAHEGSMRVYDMQTGVRLEEHLCQFFGFSTGEHMDSAAVTNERAITIGDCAYIGDLTAVGTPQFIIAHHEVGTPAVDLAITPDGTIAAVRGGNPNSSSPGGLFLFDLATGAQLANTPGLPSSAFNGAYSTALDTVAVTNTHAVFLSLVSASPSTPETRITIFSLRHDGGPAPVIAFETSAAAGLGRDLDGAPSDLMITPDGQYVAVRSEFEVALYDLAGHAAGPVWRAVPAQNPGSLGNASMDTLVATNSRIATITRWSQGGVGAQLDLFDLAGNQLMQRFVGDPHDLAVTPAGNRLLVRTSSGAELFDLDVDPSVGPLVSLASTSAQSTHTGFGAGLDSLEVTDTTAAMLFRKNSTTSVRVYDISADTFDLTFKYTLPDSATDLDLTPDGTRLVVSADHSVEVLDLRLGAPVLSQSFSGAGPVPWSDGVVVNNDQALAWGVHGFDLGWVATLDLFSAPVTYCEAQNNSTGSAAHIHGTGSASITSNDLNLWATGLPAAAPAMLVYGDGQSATPFGHGTSCVAGTVFRFPLGAGQANGTLGEVVNVTGAPATGGAITAGSTWNFQFLYRDGRTRRTTDAVTVTFLP